MSRHDMFRISRPRVAKTATKSSGHSMLALAVGVVGVLAVGALSERASAEDACANSGKPIVWRGSEVAHEALLKTCSEMYHKETGERSAMDALGSALGIRAAAVRGVHVGGVCRHRKLDHFESDHRVGAVVIGWDALVAITHPSNPVSSLTHEELVHILRGRIVNWSAVGGSVQPIILAVRRGRESGIGIMTRLLILDDPDFAFASDAIQLRDTRTLERFLENTPGAIAITDLSSARGRKVKVLNIERVAPDSERVASGEYPYFRPLHLVHRHDGGASTGAFVAWMVGERGQAMVSEHGAIALNDGPTLATRYRLWNATERISNWDDLTRNARRAMQDTDLVLSLPSESVE